MTPLRRNKPKHEIVNGRKVCMDCLVEKPLSEFGLTSSLNKKPRCKVCDKLNNRKYGLKKKVSISKDIF